MPDIAIHIDLEGHVRRVGRARLNKVRGTETITFEYADGWLADLDCFSIEPALTLTRGTFPPPPGQPLFGSIGDSCAYRTRPNAPKHRTDFARRGDR
jgi:serine/threonine-protein kinase HipA